MKRAEQSVAVVFGPVAINHFVVIVVAVVDVAVSLEDLRVFVVLGFVGFERGIGKLDRRHDRAGG